MTINAYPLQWPEGWKRTPQNGRRVAAFGKKQSQEGSSWKRHVDLSVSDGVKRVLTELERMGIKRDDVVISTNLKVRLDGFPRSDQARPGDPGAAVYWEERGGSRRCIAVDVYLRVEDNLAAVAATLDAMRAIERHGGAAVLERAFTGFTALPAPDAVQPWWEVLGVLKTATQADVKEAWRRQCSMHHPDKPGGSHEKMAEINRAYEESTK